MTASFLKTSVSNGLRTPYKKPLTDPVTVEEVHGNKATAVADDGTETPDVHVEDMILPPVGTRDFESCEPLEFPEDDE